MRSDVDQAHTITVQWQPTKVEETNVIYGTDLAGNSVATGRTRTRVNDGPPKQIEVKVRVLIDTRGIAEDLGRKAFFSRGKKSKEIGGLVVVTVASEKVRG